MEVKISKELANKLSVTRTVRINLAMFSRIEKDLEARKISFNRLISEMLESMYGSLES